MSRIDANGAAALMGSYCDGDERAFTALYRVVAPKLSQFFRHRTGDVVRADDLVQQTFLKLHRARATYVRGADPLPWIYTIAHRVFVDDCRARAKTPVAEEQVIAVEPRTTDRWLRDALAAAIDRLPTSHRVVFWLTQIEGLSLADTAKRLGTTVGAVKLRAHRGRQTLRALLAASA